MNVDALVRSRMNSSISLGHIIPVSRPVNGMNELATFLCKDMYANTYSLNFFGPSLYFSQTGRLRRPEKVRGGGRLITSDVLPKYPKSQFFEVEKII